MTGTNQSTGNRVFISCVSGEFQHATGAYPGLRGDLTEYLRRADCDVKDQESFRQEGQCDLLVKLDGYIRNCTAVIHLIGKETGANAMEDYPKGVSEYLQAEPQFLAKWPDLRTELGDFSGLSYTQWEAFMAAHHGVPLFVYFTPDGKTAQAVHHERTQNLRRFGNPFERAQDLFGKLIGDLREIIATLPPLPDIASSRILRHSPPILFGREKELAELDRVWAARDRVHVYSLVAWGGSGKTSLVAHWVTERLAARGWPGVERYYDWSFYSQGARENSQASADFFIADALRFFGDADPQAGGPWERGQRLAHLVKQRPTLLVLDGLEPLQYPPNSPQAGELKDQALTALLNGLATQNRGLCVVTTREPLKSIEPFHQSGCAEEHRLDQLTKEAAIALLRHLQITGTEAEMEEAWTDAGGHALTLQLLGRFLADAHGGDIRRRREVKLEEADRETPGRTAMKVMLAYEKWLESAGPDRQRDLAVLRLVGLFDRPASAACIAAVCAEPAIPELTDSLVDMAEWKWNKALKDLEDLDLITVNRDPDTRELRSIDAHPLVREYFAGQLRKQTPEAFREAHSRLFDYLCENTEHQPDTLEDLQPLYQAVTHGCLAGRHEQARVEVYRDRILRTTDADGFYSWKKLGAVGADLQALSSFFKTPWHTLAANSQISEPDWILSEVALRLRALGRLTDALQPMRLALDYAKEKEDWIDAAKRASNLSELEATLGNLVNAVNAGLQAVRFADKSNDLVQRSTKRTTLAEVLHLSGKKFEASALLEEAERLHGIQNKLFPELYSLHGFRFTDLLLSNTEHLAWRHILQVSPPLSANLLPEFDCLEAKRRARRSLLVAKKRMVLLSIGLDNLTLARATLYEYIISPQKPPSHAKNLVSFISAALFNLARSGEVEFLAQALLTTTLCKAYVGDKEEAEAHLAEAQQIAERGPMPLYLADVHLHRARLFQNREELAKARTLIEKHKYGRRREELEDAEAAAEHW